MRHFKCGAVITAPKDNGVHYERFLLEPSTKQPGWWVLTDREFLVVVRFEEHHFNDNQKVTILEDSYLQSDDITDSEAAQVLARVMREIGDFASCFPEVCL